jgi:hypothetical protein
MALIGWVVLLAGFQPPVDAPPAAPEAVPVQRPSAAAPPAEAAEEPVAEPEAPEAQSVPEPETAEPPPPTIAEPPPPAEPEPVVEAAPAAEPVAAPEPLPAAAQPEAPQPAPAQPPLELPEYSGRAMVNAAALLGAVGWGTSIATTVLTVRGCRGCSGAGLVTLIGLRWVANGAALGLAIPGGYYRGRYHAVAGELGEERVRDPKPYIWGGAASLAIGSALWFVTRAWGTVSIIERPSWGPGTYAAYFTSLQVGWTAASAGAGLLSYGLSMKKEQKRLGQRASVHVAPQLGLQQAGLSLSGRF